jgi:hypothetical protein
VSHLNDDPRFASKNGCVCNDRFASGAIRNETQRSARFGSRRAAAVEMKPPPEARSGYKFPVEILKGLDRNLSSPELFYILKAETTGVDIEIMHDTSPFNSRGTIGTRRT